MPPLLPELWREQHPKGHEQKQFDFSSKKLPRNWSHSSEMKSTGAVALGDVTRKQPICRLVTANEVAHAILLLMQNETIMG